MRSALFLALTLAAVPAFAQDDDDLPALPSAKPKPKPAPARAKPRPQPKKAAPVAVDDDLPALPPQKGDLVVKLSSPMKGAKLTIDDREIGTLPQPPQSLIQGDHTVVVKRLGFAQFSKKVTIAPSKANEVVVTLEANAAVLTVSSDVAGAQVFVNGRLAGTAPLVELEVPPGSVEIAVKKDGYHDGTQTLAAKAGRDYPIEVKLGAPIASTVVAAKEDAPVRNDLTPNSSSSGGDDLSGSTTATTTIDNSPVYQKWWFWTAAVVLAAGAGTVIGVVAYNNSGGGTLANTDFDCNKNGKTCDGGINLTGIVPIKF